MTKINNDLIKIMYEEDIHYNNFLNNKNNDSKEIINNNNKNNDSKEIINDIKISLTDRLKYKNTVCYNKMYEEDMYYDL